MFEKRPFYHQPHVVRLSCEPFTEGDDDLWHISLHNARTAEEQDFPSMSALVAHLNDQADEQHAGD